MNQKVNNIIFHRVPFTMAKSPTNNDCVLKHNEYVLKRNEYAAAFKNQHTSCIFVSIR